jgi:hypothetical protein
MFDGFVGQLIWGPMGHWSATLLGIFAGQRQDSRDLLGGELARRTAPGQVAENLLDRPFECGCLLAAFDQDESIEVLGPVFSPGPDSMTLTPDMQGDVLRGLKGQKSSVFCNLPLRRRWSYGDATQPRDDPRPHRRRQGSQG